MASSPHRSPPEEKYNPPPESPPQDNQSEKSPSKAIVAVERYSPLRSPTPREEKKPVSPPADNVPSSATVKSPSPVIVVNRSIREELSVATKVDSGGDGRNVEEGGERRSRALSSILRRSRREVMVKRAELGFRVCAALFCLVSFSVMAADKTQGWAGDSFDRYKEYRYCISVTVIAFVYAGFQACTLSYHMITAKHVIPLPLRCFFDFSMDQILTYLLISASSSAATRVDDWQSNWGKDEFTEMASASIGMSFLAFIAFAFSSLISGYYLCIRYST
ncbi:PREDICTED: CASP-like protein 4A3 [Nelumbo nucifera]|uniref:CASP-like protein n=2 Tax=Nelumbo nucifera TaxID=4432 RepID=A0A1U7ZSP2_NELNU|nr:PREDICTED: CASP-like protein 4A3 [Nelumbo nucifera]DAD34593.1 TPA_asm: hypothetical protein HUJ06_005233 [Nelumbo nucifera]